MKRLLLIAGFSIIVSVAFGQRFDAGLLGGFNGSQVEGDSYNGYNKPGILLGTYVQTDIAPAIFAAMELKYSQKGSRNKIDPKNEDLEKYIMRLGYADVPIYMGFRTSERISIIAGASFGYLMHGDEYDNYGKFQEENRVAFNDFDLQALGGVQFEMMDRLKLDLRMALSLLPVRELPGEEATTYYWLNNQFNNVISLALYYRLGD